MNKINFRKSEYYDLLTGNEKEKADSFIHNSFEADYKLFDEKICNIHIFFPYDKDPQTCYDDKINVIQEQIDWVVSNRGTIIDCINKNDIVKLVDRWLRDYEKTEDGCCFLENGTKPRLPVTEEDVTNSLWFSSLSVRFEDNMDKPRMDICFEFDPDYFDGGFIAVLIDGNKELTYVHGMGRNRRE